MGVKSQGKVEVFINGGYNCRGASFHKSGIFGLKSNKIKTNKKQMGEK